MARTPFGSTKGHDGSELDTRGSRLRTGRTASTLGAHPRHGSPMQLTHALRPKKSSFLFQYIIGALTFWSIMTAIATGVLVANDVGFTAVPSLVALGMIIFAVVSAFAAFRKEHYEVHGKHIIARRGGLLSDQVTELDFVNVTHIKQRLPWIRYRFFDVGDVIVQSAGSRMSQVVFRSVQNPDQVYQMLQDKLRDNGYSMRRGQLLHEEQPAPLGALLDVIAMGFGIVLGMVVLFGAIVAEAVESVDGLAVGSLLGLGGLAMAGLTLMTMVLRFLDIKNRTYQVYDDVVVYTEGFLSRSNAVIPFENIADANTAQTLIDQVLGHYDVKISCQGSTAEIKFRRLKRGEELKARVAQLVAAAEEAKRQGAAAKAEATAATMTAAGADRAPRRTALPAVPPEQAWTAELRPNAVREILGLTPLLPLFPVFVGLALIAWVGASARRYTVGTSSARVKAGILNVTETDFAYDKITGALIKRGPLDRFMRTVTIELWSIGSNRPLVFSAVDESSVHIDALLRQVGIARTAPERALPASFDFGVWIRVSLPIFVLMGIVSSGIIVGAIVGDVPELILLAVFLLVLPLPFYVYRQAWTNKQALTLHRDHAELQSGLFWRRHYFASYQPMKKLRVYQYPWSRQGDLKIFVAGEREVQDNNQSQGGASVPYSFDVRYLESVENLGPILDGVLRGVRDPVDERPHVPEDPLLEARPHIGHAMVPPLLASLFMFPLVPFVVPWFFVSVKRRRFVLERNRVVYRSGVLFKTEMSVLYDRIDSIQRKQGALGKLFGTGNVTIYTAGSSLPDLVLGAVPDHGAVYERIRAQYGG